MRYSVRRLIMLTAFFAFIIPGFSLDKKDIHYFIRKAWETDSSIKQAEFEVKKYKQLQLEAVSVYSTKINTTTWLAPIYSASGNYQVVVLIFVE